MRVRGRGEGGPLHPMCNYWSSLCQWCHERCHMLDEVAVTVLARNTKSSGVLGA